MKYLTLLIASVTLGYATPYVTATCTPFYSAVENECIGGTGTELIGARGLLGSSGAQALVFHAQSGNIVWNTVTRVAAESHWNDAITFYSPATITMAMRVDIWGSSGIEWAIDGHTGTSSGNYVYTRTFNPGDTLLMSVTARTSLVCGIGPRRGCADDFSDTPAAAASVTLFPSQAPFIYSSESGRTWFVGDAVKIAHNPEPGTFVMLGSAVTGLLWRLKRARRHLRTT